MMTIYFCVVGLGVSRFKKKNEFQNYAKSKQKIRDMATFDPFLNNPWFLRVCSAILLKSA